MAGNQHSRWHSALSLALIALFAPQGALAATCKYDTSIVNVEQNGEPFALRNDEFYCYSWDPLRFGLDVSGNVVLQDVTNEDAPFTIWSAGTSAATDGLLQLLDDGNLVLWRDSFPPDESTILWESGTKRATTLIFDSLDGSSLRDNRLFLQDNSGARIWFTGTDGSGVYGRGGCSSSAPWYNAEVGFTLGVREYICLNRNLVFGLDDVGDLALLDVSSPTYRKLWSAGTETESDGFAELREDGRLVVWSSSDPNAAVTWESNTLGNQQLRMDFSFDEDRVDESYASLVDEERRAVWWTKGNGGVYGGGPCIGGAYSLETGAHFERDQWFCYALYNGNLVFGMDSEGDLTFLDVSGDEPFTMWSAGTSGRGQSATLLSSGDLVVYGDAFATEVIWNSGTNGNGALTLTIHNEDITRESYAYLVDEERREVWWTKGNGGVYGGGPCIGGYSYSLETGAHFERDQWFCYTLNGNLVFGMDSEGDLTFLDVSGDEPFTMWSAGTSGRGQSATLLSSGDMVVYSDTSATETIWSSGTQRNGEGVTLQIHFDENNIRRSYAFIQDDIYNTVWWTLREGGVSGKGRCLSSSYHSMGTGSLLTAGAYLCGEGDLILGMDESGDFAFLDVSGDTPFKIWSAGTGGNPNAFLYFNPDGNLVVHQDTNTDSPILWQSKTAGTNANYVFVTTSAITRDSYWSLTEEIGYFTAQTFFRSDGGGTGQNFGSGAFQSRQRPLLSGGFLLLLDLVFLVGF